MLDASEELQTYKHHWGRGRSCLNNINMASQWF